MFLSLKLSCDVALSFIAISFIALMIYDMEGMKAFFVDLSVKFSGYS